MSAGAVVATVLRHEYPRELPGYVRVVLVDDRGQAYAVDVIELEETEAHFEHGRRITLDGTTSDDGSESFRTVWTLPSGPCVRRVRRLGA